MTDQFNTISFYRYTEIENPELLQEKLRNFCKQHNILGRILIGTEGINGAVSGKQQEIEFIKQELQKTFTNLTFREQSFNENTYHKLVIRVRQEICVFGEETDVKNTGVHLPPQQLKQWYEQDEDFVIVDARNDYEYDVGRFRGAVKMPIKNFREFADASKNLEQYKEQGKKVVLYCTGGVRCEKASAYLKEQGFPEVYQLDGGIINYVNQVGDDKWQGGLFVFDDRLVSDVADSITACVHCNKETSDCINCHNLDCDKLTIVCSDCREQFNSCCSEQCKNSPRQRPTKEIKQERKLDILGRVENYYPKAKVALVKLEKPLTANTEILITGKTTTDVKDVLSELRDESGNKIDSAQSGDIVTFPVSEKVRKNDLVVSA